MKTIARFHKNEEAHLFRSFLESQGIGAHLLDEAMSQVCWHYSAATGGVRVSVAEEDAERAEDLFEEYQGTITSGPEVERGVKSRFSALVLSIIIAGMIIAFLMGLFRM